MSRRSVIIAVIVLLAAAGISVYAVSSNNGPQPVVPQAPAQQEPQEVVQEPSAAPEPQPSAAPVQESAVGLERAKEVALQQVPGASEADIVKAFEDYDDGVHEYEIEIHHDGYEYDFEILASSGEIISKDVDHIEWDDRYDD